MSLWLTLQHTLLLFVEILVLLPVAANKIQRVNVLHLQKAISVLSMHTEERLQRQAVTVINSPSRIRLKKVGEKQAEWGKKHIYANLFLHSSFDALTMLSF